MTLTGLNTFVAGTKAKASEVNENFSLVKSFVDELEGNVENNTSDISTLTNNKADINGNPSNRFAVADAINNTDAINKETLFKYIHNSQRYINGLDLTRSNSNTINISAGSAMDSTFTHIMVLDSSVSIQNSNQAQNATYYVYLISKEDGTTQVIISTDSVTPSLPSGYIYFRQIGKYFTFSTSNDICMVVDVTEYIRYKYDYTNPHWYDNNGGSNSWYNTYTAERDGFLIATGRFNFAIVIDGQNVASWYFGDQGFNGTLNAPISKGQTFTFQDGITSARFIPKTKYTI